MPAIAIVLVQPLYPGNVGFTARAMKNFGFSDLVLVDPCEIGDEAYTCASHAGDVLDRARVRTLAEVRTESNLLVATTGEVPKSVCTTVRMPYYAPAEIHEQIRQIDGRVSILFGRENWGLNNGEVALCDLVCTIPSSHDYPILNLSHAVAILCYELAGLQRGTYALASAEEMEYLYAHIDQFLDRIDHPDFKRENTMTMARRILGRTQLTPREASTIHGLLRRAEWHMNNKE